MLRVLVFLLAWSSLGATPLALWVWEAETTRLRTDPVTRDYLLRRLAEGKTSKEIRRCLKRYVGGQVFRTLTASHPSAAAATSAALTEHRSIPGNPRWFNPPFR